MAKVAPKEKLKIKTSKEEFVIDYADVNEAGMIVRSINHPIRKKIIEMLQKVDETNVTDIYVKLRMEQSIVSQHLAILRSTKVLKTRRDGKFIYYSLDTRRLKRIGKKIEDLAK